MTFSNRDQHENGTEGFSPTGSKLFMFYIYNNNNKKKTTPNFADFYVYFLKLDNFLYTRLAKIQTL